MTGKIISDGGPAWEDATSYSQGERGRISPTAWQANVDGFKVRVSCAHRYYPEKWVVSCLAADIDTHDIGPLGRTKEQMQKFALDYVGMKLKAKADRMNSAADAMLAARVQS